jgi:zinc ribbon protein
MAFCNSCGATLVTGTRFCSKCGAAVLASTPVSSGTSTPTATAPGAVPVPVVPRSSDSTLKIVFIIVGAIIIAVVIGVASIGFIGWRIAHHTRVHQDGNNVKVETPFGTVESTKDPDEAARNLGVDIYPGAQTMKEGASTTNFGGMRTVAATFETSDPLDKVAAFYKAKFPNAMVTTSQSNHCTIVSNDAKNIVTINAEGRGDKTRIQIAKVSHDSDSSSSSQ